MISTPPSPLRPSNATAAAGGGTATPGGSSTTSATSTQSSAQAPAAKPPAPPVEVLSSKPARIYSVVHPVLLLGLYVVRFPALVDDPVAVMLGELPWLAVLQVLFVMVCLPPTGSVNSSSSSSAAGTGAGAGSVATGGQTSASSSVSSISRSVTGSDSSSDANSTLGDGDGEKNLKRTASSGPSGSGLVLRAGKVGYRRKNPHHQKGDGCGISAKLIPALLSLILTFLLAAPVLAILLVLFGAPLTTHNAHTLLCAAHMAILSATALIYVHGVDGAVWREVWSIARPADAVWGGALGSCLGAWFGAVPIPLDWDRPWQAFPITILTGAYIGYAIGSLLSRTSWLYGKRIKFEPEEDEEEEEGKKSA